MSDTLQGTNHLKTNSIHQDCLANRRPSRKEHPPRFIADHDDCAFLRIVQLIEPAAFIDRQISNLIEVSWHAHHLTAALKIIADRANITARDDWRGKLHVRTLGDNVLVI